MVTSNIYTKDFINIIIRKKKFKLAINKISTFRNEIRNCSSHTLQTYKNSKDKMFDAERQENIKLSARNVI